MAGRLEAITFVTKICLRLQTCGLRVMGLQGS